MNGLSGPIEIAILSVSDSDALDSVAPEVFDAAIDPTLLAAFLCEPGHCLIVARDGKLVVGQARAIIHRNPDEPSQLYIDNLGVTPSYKRRGLARRLLAEAFAWGRKNGCVGGWVATEIDNHEANGFYRSALRCNGTQMIYYEFDVGPTTRE